MVSVRHGDWPVTAAAFYTHTFPRHFTPHHTHYHNTSTYHLTEEDWREEGRKRKRTKTSAGGRRGLEGGNSGDSVTASWGWGCGGGQSGLEQDGQVTGQDSPRLTGKRKLTAASPSFSDLFSLFSVSLSSILTASPSLFFTATPYWGMPLLPCLHMQWAVLTDAPPPSHACSPDNACLLAFPFFPLPHCPRHY